MLSETAINCLPPLPQWLFRHDNRQGLSSQTSSHEIVLLLFPYVFDTLLKEVYSNYCISLRYQYCLHNCYHFSSPPPMTLLLLLLLFVHFLSELPCMFPSCTDHANAYFWTCLMDGVSSCPSNSAVAICSVKLDVRVSVRERHSSHLCYSLGPLLGPLSSRSHLESQLLPFVKIALIGISSVPRSKIFSDHESLTTRLPDVTESSGGIHPPRGRVLLSGHEVA